MLRETGWNEEVVDAVSNIENWVPSDLCEDTEESSRMSKHSKSSAISVAFAVAIFVTISALASVSREDANIEGS
jgi:hypothetical protein